MMMGKIVEHFITGLQQDCEQLREQRDLSVFDSEARKKKEVKLYQQERKYVKDLEQEGPLNHFSSRLFNIVCHDQVCSDYSPILMNSTGYSTINRKKTSKVKRKGSHIQMLIEDFKKSSDTEHSSSDTSQPSSQE